MRKIFSFLVMAMLLITALGVSATPASAGSAITYIDSRFVLGKGIVFIFEGTGYKNKDVKNIQLILHSDNYKLGCVAVKKENKIVCVGDGDLTVFAGQVGSITLVGQTFSVIIPDRSVPANNSLSCPDGTVPGADVTFFTMDETTDILFIEGATLSAVNNNAQSYLGGYFISIEDVGSLYCGEMGE